VITKKLLLDIVKYILFFGVGIALFIWVYKGQDLDSIIKGLTRFHYGWIAASFAAMMFSHLFRAMRWRMLIESIGYKPGLLNTFLSILVMYLANSVVTRMGEVTRCGILKKYEGVPFTSQLGTVLVERVVDVLFLMVILAVALVFNWDILSTFINQTQSAEDGKLSFLHSPIVIIAGVIILLGSIVAIVFRHRIKRLPFVMKILSYSEKFSEGLKSVFRLRQPVGFGFLTVAIYGCYFLGTFFVLKAFAPTASLSPMVAFAVLASGSIGMIAPVPTGICAFHWFAFNTIVLFGVAAADSQLVVLVLHGSTTLFVVIIGAIALGLLPIVNRSKKVVERI